MGEELSPGSGVLGSELDDFVKDNVLPNSHWVGTARMGSKSNAGRSAAGYEKDIVVDENLAVRGVKNLMVADASVMPYIPNGNVHSTVCVVAERAVKIILGEEWERQEKKMEEVEKRGKGGWNTTTTTKKKKGDSP